MDIRRQYSLYTLGIHRIPTDSLRCNLEAHQQLINRSKEQIVRQGWEPEGWQLVRFPKSRPFFETWGVPAPFQLLGHRRLDLCWHQIYLGRSSYCCCQPQLNWIKMRLSGGWRCSMKNYAVFWWNSISKTFPKSCQSRCHQLLPSCSQEAGSTMIWKGCNSEPRCCCWYPGRYHLKSLCPAADLKMFQLEITILIMGPTTSRCQLKAKQGTF